MKEETKQECKLCGELTSTVYGLNFKAVPVCDKCAAAIAYQEIVDMFNNK